MKISEAGLQEARKRAHARTREWFPDDEVRGAVVAAVETACLASSERSPYARAAHAVQGLVDTHVVDIEPHMVRTVASRVVNAFSTVAGGETLAELRTTAGGAR